jgi:hypothetical protein
MKTLHIAPGDSAAGSLIKAIQDAGMNEPVLTGGHDDLSCGPIDADDPLVRRNWWAKNHQDWRSEADGTAFWEQVFDPDNRPVVWFGRHSAFELAFFLHWAERLGERPYYLIDVTGLELPFTKKDGSQALSRPTAAVSIVRSEGLRSLLGSERLITQGEREEAQLHWRQLRRENAPFRIITEKGLTSAPADYFDHVLLEQATAEWQKIARIIGGAMADNCEPYFQVGDIMLLTRVVALVSEGKLLADGNPWEMRQCNVRLPAL